MTYKMGLIQSKYKFKYVIISILTSLIAYTTHSILGEYNDEKIKSQFLNFSNINKGVLAAESKEYHKINEIISNINSYPISLIDLVSKNIETIDFVADYPKHIKEIPTDDISVKEDYKKGEIPLFIQWDKRWGYSKYGHEFIAVNGCGPTSLAMVAVGLRGNSDINPKVVADYSKKNGYLVNGIGTKWSIMTEGAKHFGLIGKEINISPNTIISKLKEGHPIIASMGPGEFTSKGHFIVLTGISNGEKIIVNDPNSKVKSEKKWDIDVFMKEAKKLWAFKSM